MKTNENESGVVVKPIPEHLVNGLEEGKSLGNLKENQEENQDDETVDLMEIVAQRYQRDHPLAQSILEKEAAAGKELEAVIRANEKYVRNTTHPDHHGDEIAVGVDVDSEIGDPFLKMADSSGTASTTNPDDNSAGLEAEPTTIERTPVRRRSSTPGAFEVAPPTLSATDGPSDANAMAISPDRPSAPREQMESSRSEQGASAIREESTGDGTTPSGDTPSENQQLQEPPVANPINEEVCNKEPLQQAQEYDVSAQENRQSERRQAGNSGLALLGFFMVLAVALTLVLVLVLKKTPNEDKEPSPSITSPTPEPSMSPTAYPWDDYLMGLLPRTSVRTSQQDPSSPQALAYSWLLPDLAVNWGNNNYTDARVVQRFALATFYYSTNGEHWTENEGWLDHTAHECTWFSSFESACYDDAGLEGVFEDFFLDANNLQGSIPTELFLLSHLRVVGLPQNSLTGSIPVEVGLLENILALALFQNELTGTIPILPPSLMMVVLASNQLSGSVPSELGHLAIMFEFNVTDNSLQGPIPSELGELKGLQKLWLSDNDLTGTIPEKIAFLASNGTLQGLAVHGNYLSGAIPSNLCTIDVSFDCTEHLCGCNCSCVKEDPGMMMQVAPGEALEWAP